MAPRLTADFWVHAYLRRLQAAGIAAYVASHGDATAGAVMVKVATLDGRARAYQRRFELDRDARVWVEFAAGAEEDIDALLRRERGRDPDLWLIEVEDRQGRSLLDEAGLAQS